MKDIIHALKYERRRSITRRLGALMRERGADLLRDADVVVPVPLHPRREYQRGFNQAADLAGQLGVPMAPLLKRVMHTQSQIDLPRAQRQANVAKAFALNLDEPAGSPLRGLALRRLSVQESIRIAVLVDDVSTTGATLEACARMLKSAGVNEVRALTAARVVNERH